MHQHEKLNYVEFAAKDLAATKVFFQSVFDWEFVNYGPDYTAFSNQGLTAGFYSAPLAEPKKQAMVERYPYFIAKILKQQCCKIRSITTKSLSRFLNFLVVAVFSFQPRRQ